MPELIALAIEDEHWRDPDITPLASTFCRATLIHFGLEPEHYEISILACDDARILELNGEFRAKPTATNVLSWPSEERANPVSGQHPALPQPGDGIPIELGDIAISFGVCQREAETAGKPMEQHVGHLLVHATLHLLGYDHIVTQDALLMEEIERQVLASLGQPDPYGDN